MVELVQTVRAAARRMARDRRFTFTIGLVFMLGLGANAVIFGIIDDLLLRPPAQVDRPDEVRRVLVQRRAQAGADATLSATLSYPTLGDIRDVEGIRGVAAYTTASRILGRHEQAYSARITQVTGTYFDVLGVRPHLGRPLIPADDDAAAEPVTVISHGMWQDRYGAQEDVLGRTIDIRGKQFTIVGVAPPGFRGIDLGSVDLWVPLHALASNASFWEDNRRFHWLNVVARLDPGMEMDAIAARATTLHQRAEGQTEGATDGPRSRIAFASAVAARGPLASGESRVARWLFGVALLVLIIACANVASLLLARATSRASDTGVRLALGASRRRIVLESVLDAMLPAALGALGAVAMAAWLGGLVRSTLLPDVAWGDQLVDLRLIAFVTALTCAAGAAIGLVTGLRAARHDARRLMSHAAQGASGRALLTGGLVVVQTALSVVLLVGATLFLHSLGEVRATDLGFDADRVLVATPVQDQSWETEEEQALFFEEAKERLARLPGVAEAASAGMTTPFGNQTFLDVVRGAENVPGDDRVAWVTNVTPGYFRTLGMPLLDGREIRETDAPCAEPVAVVNQTLAERFWPGEEAVGRCLGLDGTEAGDCVRVVGVVTDAKRRSLEESASPHVYLSSAQDISGWGGDDVLFVRTSGATAGAAVEQLVRQELLALRPTLRYAEVRLLEGLVDPQARPWRLGATMLSLFGLLALCVTAFGIYSTMAFDVARRSRELAIRSALGASGRRLLRGVVGRGLVLCGSGVVLGLGIAVLAAPAAADLLYRTDPVDPAIFAVVGSGLLIVGIVATLGPGSRVVRTEPALVMRAE